VFLLLALALLRVIGLHTSVVDLFYDEAQYWAWGRDLAFGYYSKPPLLAWIIAASEQVCGSGEACVRIASPLFYFATSLVVYAIADELYGKQAAFWSALAFALATGVSFSARIISTDVPLLFCWSVALLAYLKLLTTPSWRWTAVFGIALGFGMLAKYAMVYFGFCMLAAASWDRAARDLLWRPQTWIAFAIALLLLAPNIYWNITNEFATLRHTGDNLTGAGWSLRPLASLLFLGSQFGVMGPLIFGAFLVLVAYAIRDKVGLQDKLMLAFAIPPVALVAALAVFRGANPNWAAPAAVSMTILVVAWWLRHGGWRWLAASLGIALAVQIAMLIGDAYADRVSIPGLGRKSDIYQRTLGWRMLGDNVARLAREAGAQTVAAEGRPEVAALTYYLRDTRYPVVSWPRDEEARSYFDMEQAINDNAPEPVLLITDCKSTARLERFYAQVITLPEVRLRPGPNARRKYQVFKLSGRKQTLEPLGRCPLE
jgi:hypothetical protein